VTLKVDMFWSFRSPYSYLALSRAIPLTRTYDLEILARPVYPLAVRVPDFFKRTNPQFAPYVQRDALRVAQWLGVPIRAPRPDPIVQDMKTLEVAAEQPRIRRLTRLGAAAQEAGRGLAFIDEVSRVLWDGTVDQWDQGDHLAGAAARSGLDLATLDAAITAAPARYEAIITENERAHAQSGHWGVPTFVFEGEPFFGQDRIDLLVWRLKQKGLRERMA
jgi:2-hydroxychromene-2-carboxylate isomerase